MESLLSVCLDLNLKVELLNPRATPMTLLTASSAYPTCMFNLLRIGYTVSMVVAPLTFLPEIHKGDVVHIRLASSPASACQFPPPDTGRCSGVTCMPVSDRSLP